MNHEEEIKRLNERVNLLENCLLDSVKNVTELTKQILKFQDSVLLSLSIKVESKEKPRLYYNSGGLVSLGDVVIILPSESVVTNADTIKYDERIEGKTAKVIGINVTEKTIKIEERVKMPNGEKWGAIYLVPIHWADRYIPTMKR
jgi:hypothetical protein